MSSAIVLAAALKLSDDHVTATRRLPTPRKPPKSITAARGRPASPTSTSTIRPTTSPPGPTTWRPRMLVASPW
jgi:hypothetical protein